MAWGKKNQQLCAELDRRGLAEGDEDIPPWREKCEVPAHLRYFWDAFWDLATDRPEGVRAIPFSSLHHYACRYGLDDLDDFERFKALVWAIDRVQLDVSLAPAVTEDEIPHGRKALGSRE